MRTIRACIVAAVAIAISAASSNALAAKWWNTKWAYRVGVELASKPLKATLSGDNVAVVDFRTGGHIQDGGVDIRVTTQSGREVPHRIMMTGPGDLAKIAFATRPNIANYYVYFGNPKSAPAKKPLKINRGVMLQMWRYRGGSAKTYKQLKKTLALAKEHPPLGTCFRRWIFNGHNPFGRQSALAAVYTAYFIAPQDGKYLFVTSSHHASFLLIDDKLIVKNGGWHGPQKDTHIRGVVTLRAGLHKMSFEQISKWWYPVAVVAWRPPGQRKITLIPPAAFTKIASGVSGAIQKYRQAKSVDFQVLRGGETFVGNRYYQRRVFRAMSAGISQQRIDAMKWEWNFGDGQTATGPEVQHVYLKPGLYSVTLRAKVLSRTLTQKHQVQIDRNWDAVIFNRLDSLGSHEKIISQYNFIALPTKNLTEALLFFQRVKNPEMMLRVCKAFFKRGSADDSDLKIVVPICETLLVRENSPKLAVRALIKAAAMTKTRDLSARYRIRAGRLQNDELGEPVDAMKIYLAVLNNTNGVSKPTLRLARIALGDIWRSRGDYAKAHGEYERAGIGGGYKPTDRAFVRGDLARQVEDYIRTRDFISAGAALDKWANAFPCDKLEGYLTLLRVKLLRAQRRYLAAGRLGQIVAKANPTGSYAAELFMLAADSYFKANEPLKTRAILKKVVKDYPESPLHTEAVEMLKPGR
ncbi:MAG: PKD domain-containing protein [Phycisphaerae bacterium]|nr:PKD domain-containing protein [Phycisphaerae bacterium]